MTTEEDILFLGIIQEVEKMNLNEYDSVKELMERFARVYKAKIDQGEWEEREFSPNVKSAVKYYIPEEYL